MAILHRVVVPSVTLAIIALTSISSSRSPGVAWARTIAGASAAATEICAGDCAGTRTVASSDLIALVNVALGSRDTSACPFGIPAGTAVMIALILEALNNAMSTCPQVAATETPTVMVTPPPTATATPVPTAATHFCDLSGSVQTTDNGVVVIPGGPANAPDLRFLQLPVGFCAHFYANVGNTRQLRFAPGGELFVASPTTATTGGGPDGRSAIIVLPDDDHDGVADAPTTFLNKLPSTQGLLFTTGYFYYQDGTKIMRVPYVAGDRTPSASSKEVADINLYTSTTHWPKPLDIADNGTIYVGNGGDQSEHCDPAHPFHGGILKLDGSSGGRPVAKGFRNPISLRCSRGHNLCFAIELAKDFTATEGGREKLAPIRHDDDWGFPCCATKDLPFPDVTPVPDCSAVASESGSFLIGDTPFDLDFETNKWPVPWNNRVYVPLHGAYGSWTGARVVAIALDPTTGQLLPGSDLSGGSSGAMMDFATGWDDGTRLHGRPANVAFAGDGRLFLGNDNDGNIIWIAPLDLPIGNASPQ
jgi:glucose/arabinose dehydrogenase